MNHLGKIANQSFPKADLKWNQGNKAYQAVIKRKQRKNQEREGDKRGFLDLHMKRKQMCRLALSHTAVLRRWKGGEAIGGERVKASVEGNGRRRRHRRVTLTLVPCTTACATWAFARISWVGLGWVCKKSSNWIFPPNLATNWNLARGFFGQMKIHQPKMGTLHPVGLIQKCFCVRFNICISFLVLCGEGSTPPEIKLMRNQKFIEA